MIESSNIIVVEEPYCNSIKFNFWWQLFAIALKNSGAYVIISYLSEVFLMFNATNVDIHLVMRYMN